jgi:hypothetical protein
MAIELPPHSVLQAQAAQAAGNLARAQKMLNLSQLSGVLPAGVRDSLQDRLRAQQREIAALAEATRPDTADGGRWRELEQLTGDAEKELAESLGFLEGALIRGAGLDDGICAIADALLDELSDGTRIDWARLTILAAEEQFAPRAGIIHLRFPEFTVWALPLAAHEFGHLVAQELRDLKADGTYRQPVADEIARAGAGASHQRELFADVFATYALGPAFACTSVLLRFSPARAASTDTGRSHPNDGKRVAAILRTLRWLSRREDPVTRPYDGIAASLEATWMAAVRAGEGGELAAAGIADVAYLVDAAYVPVLDARLEAARYSGWGRALQLSALLDREGRGDVAPRVADVLNAAWHRRLANWSDDAVADRLGAAALAMCGQPGSDGNGN